MQNPIPPNDWQKLTPFQKKLIKYLTIALKIYNHLQFPKPLYIPITTAFTAFLLLFILPQHPITIPTAFGAALSIAILTYY